MNKDYLL